MISETSQNQSLSLNKNTGLTTQKDEPKMKKMIKYEVELKQENLKYYQIKNVQAHVWKFSEYIKEDPDKTLKSLKGFSKKMKRLEIACNELRTPNIGLKAISKNFNRMTCLQTLDLYSKSLNDASKVGTKSIFRNLKRLTSLLKINLDLTRLKPASDNELKILNKSLKKLTNLKSINLKFPPLTGEKGLQILSECIQKVALLQNMSLDLRACGRITSEDMESISHGLKRLTSLRILDFNFQGSHEITESKLKTLGEGLKGLTSLETINVNFQGNNFLGFLSGLVALKKTLKANVFLWSFSCNPSDCSEIEDETLKKIIEGLSQFTSLDSLSLDFPACNRITEKGLKSISEGLKKLTSLHSLSLNFSHCSKIDSQGVESIGEGLKMLTSLRTLNLHFQSMESAISATSLNSISEGLKGRICLQSMTLDLSWGNSIPDEWLKNFGECLMGLTSLHTLKLFFYSCKISEEAQNNLRELLKNHPCLKDVSL